MNRILPAAIVMALGALLLLGCPLQAQAQKSTSTAVSRRSAAHPQKKKSTALAVPHPPAARGASDADLQWMKIVYRSLNLEDPSNAALYFPEQPSDGTGNLFTIILKALAQGELAAYEYLDGRESFTRENLLNVGDVLERFHIYHTPAKGSTDKRPLFAIEDADIPSSEVLGYYMIERWEFDSRHGRMRSYVEALCPVLHRAEEFGQESVRYPMFWVRYKDLRPLIADKLILTDDDNNLARASYDDYFTLGLYKGEIYKTLNRRNKSMAQLYPDPEERRQAADSIDRRIASFDKEIWVPSLEEIQNRAAARGAATDTISAAAAPKDKKRVSGRSAGTRPAKEVKKKTRAPRSTPAATRSVRNRKR